MPWIYQYLSDGFEEFDAGPFDDFESATVDSIERKSMGYYTSQPFLVSDSYRLNIDPQEIPSEIRRIT